MAHETILLVDDDADFLDIHRTALESAGYQVLCASDSEEALALAQQHPIDGAVLDVMMRTGDEGFHLARRLRKLSATRSVPLLMVSSVNEVTSRMGHPLSLSDADRDETWLPIDQFVEKPVDPARLVDLVRALVG